MGVSSLWRPPQQNAHESNSLWVYLCLASKPKVGTLKTHTKTKHHQIRFMPHFPGKPLIPSKDHLPEAPGTPRPARPEEGLERGERPHGRSVDRALGLPWGERPGVRHEQAPALSEHLALPRLQGEEKSTEARGWPRPICRCPWIAVESRWQRCKVARNTGIRSV